MTTFFNANQKATLEGMNFFKSGTFYVWEQGKVKIIFRNSKDGATKQEKLAKRTFTFCSFVEGEKVASSRYTTFEISLLQALLFAGMTLASR